MVLAGKDTDRELVDEDRFCISITLAIFTNWFVVAQNNKLPKIDPGGEPPG